MAHRQTTQAVEAGAKKNEMVMEVIAGPETAKRLGVPEGTVVAARHVAMHADGSQETPVEDTQISPAEARRLTESWREGEVI